MAPIQVISLTVEGLHIPEQVQGSMIVDTFANCDACSMSLIKTSFTSNHTQSMFAIDSNIGPSDIALYNCTLNFDNMKNHKSTSNMSDWPSVGKGLDWNSPGKAPQFRYALTKVHYTHNEVTVSPPGESKELMTYNLTFGCNGNEFRSQDGAPWTIGIVPISY